MKAVWAVLCGIGASAGYGALSFALSGEGGWSLAAVLGTVVALALTGVPRPSGASSSSAAAAGVGDEKKAEEKKAEEEKKPEAEADEGGVEGKEGGEGGPKARADVRPSPPRLAFSPVLPPVPPQGPGLPAAPAAKSPAALWERARAMVHNIIPDFGEDAEYLGLVHAAAERGHVPALAKLGDYAIRRGAFVEAYFWTKVARRRLELEGDPQGMREIDAMLQNVRRAWTSAGMPPQFENVYGMFPEERGELGRAFLRLDSGIEVEETREYLRLLAEKGNPDAALFA